MFLASLNKKKEFLPSLSMKNEIGLLGKKEKRGLYKGKSSLRANSENQS